MFVTSCISILGSFTFKRKGILFETVAHLKINFFPHIVSRNCPRPHNWGELQL